MTSRTSMIHRCDIRRDAGRAVTDPWGDAGQPDYVAYLTGVSCYFWYGGSQTVMDGARQLEIIQLNLILPLGTAVTADDRIEQVLDRRGRVVKSGPMRIDSLGSRSEHMVLSLTEVS
jgi:hypothetical protein